MLDTQLLGKCQNVRLGGADPLTAAINPTAVNDGFTNHSATDTVTSFQHHGVFALPDELTCRTQPRAWSVAAVAPRAADQPGAALWGMATVHLFR